MTNYFLNSSILAIFNSIVLIIILLQAFPDLPKATRIVSLGLFVIGGFILSFSGATIIQWLTAISKNAGLVTLFIAVPLLSLRLFYEDYQKQLLCVAQKHMSSVISFCLLTSLVIHLLGAIISIGSVPLVYGLFNKNAELYRGHKLFLTSMMQAYMATGFWSPAWASVAVVTTGLAIPWLKLICHHGLTLFWCQPTYGGLENTQFWNISLGISGFYGLTMLIIMSPLLTGVQFVM